MKDIPDLVPDAEVFRRVWARVMPDQTLSPVVAGPPPGGDRPPKPAAQRDGLEELLETLDVGLGLAGELSRRTAQGRALWESMNKSAARVRSGWFLRTGRRWPGRSVPPSAGIETGRLFRELYLWEMGFSRLCRKLEREGEEGEDLAPGLIEASRRRREWMRRMI